VKVHIASEVALVGNTPGMRKLRRVGPPLLRRTVRPVDSTSATWEAMDRAPSPLPAPSMSCSAIWCWPKSRKPGSAQRCVRFGNGLYQGARCTRRMLVSFFRCVRRCAGL